jgi:oligopeptide transport system permease protein
VARFVARRLLLAIPVLLGASFIVFFLVYALPGDPIRALAGDRPLSPGVVAELRERYNLDDSFIVQYFKYLGGLLHGDLGVDFSGREVSETIAQRLPVTLKLATTALVIEGVVGLVAGVLAAIRRNGFVDNLVLVSTTLLVSIPVFVLGFTVQYFLGVRLGWFPISGVNDGWRSYILPGMVLAALSLAYVARLTRTSLVENLRQDYVRTARAKGLHERSVIRSHAFRNALIPVITVVGNQAAILIGGSVIVERIFNIPGMGWLAYSAISERDYTQVLATTMVLTVGVILVNLLVDICYAVIDPRIRYA